MRLSVKYRMIALLSIADNAPTFYVKNNSMTSKSRD